MSRGFRAAIFAIAGFFFGGFGGIAIAAARMNCCYGESGYPAIGAVLGVLVGGTIGLKLGSGQGQ
jgi:hypothetical protein